MEPYQERCGHNARDPSRRSSLTFIAFRRQAGDVDEDGKNSVWGDDMKLYLDKHFSKHLHKSSKSLEFFLLDY